MNTPNIEEQNLLQSELLPGESGIWSGKPNPLGVCGHGALRASNPSWFMMLWGMPFVVIGQYFVWGRFFYAARKKRSLFYAITNRRGSVLLKSPQAKTISWYLEVIQSKETTIRLNGIGAPIHGQSPPMGASGRGNKIALTDGPYLSSAIPVSVDVDNAATTSSIVA